MQMSQRGGRAKKLALEPGADEIEKGKQGCMDTPDMAMAVFLWDSFEMSKSINSGCYLSDVLKPPVFKSSVTVAKRGSCS